MRLGVSLRPVTSSGSSSGSSGAPSASEQANSLLRLGRAVREADLDLVLVGDRHVSPKDTFAPVPLIARLMAETGDVPLGAVFLAPFHHPVILAEQLATLAAFQPGPFTAAFAIGDTETQFAAFGMALKSRTVRTDEVLTLVRRLLDGDEVSFEGRYHRIDRASVGPRPAHPVRIWVGGRRGAAVERAGRLGDAWVSDTRTPDVELDVELARYQRAAGESGRPTFAVLRRSLVLGETDAAACAVAKRTVAAPDDLLVGSPSTIVEHLLAYEERGFALAIVDHISGDHGEVAESIAALGTDVLAPLRAR
jgi:alkanesulfonate monooxygenase SsuD/methylene tetrahydromethanopterin reductase-like flavin-dependent oxidoreductase (luciferase family)